VLSLLRVKKPEIINHQGERGAKNVVKILTGNEEHENIKAVNLSFFAYFLLHGLCKQNNNKI
jgi:hypothetical protein